MSGNDLPMLLTPKDVQKALNISDNQINQVYRLFRSKKFPSEKIGSKHVIPRGRFLTWMGENQN